MSLLRTISLLTASLVMSTATTAHPFHASTTEIEWNADSQRFEVAMRLRIADLEDAISAKIKTRFRVESDPKRQVRLQAYLQETFSISFVEHRQCTLHWVGYELELHDVWVYFEAESVPSADSAMAAPKPNVALDKVSSWDGLFRESTPKSLQRNVRIRNTALLELQPEQVNSVSLRMGTSRLTTSFHQRQRDDQILQVP